MDNKDFAGAFLLLQLANNPNNMETCAKGHIFIRPDCTACQDKLSDIVQKQEN